MLSDRDRCTQLYAKLTKVKEGHIGAPRAYNDTGMAPESVSFMRLVGSLSRYFRYKGLCIDSQADHEQGTLGSKLAMSVSHRNPPVNYHVERRRLRPLKFAVHRDSDTGGRSSVAP